MKDLQNSPVQPTHTPWGTVAHIAYALVTAAIMALALWYFEADTLYRAQELNLFITDPTYLHTFTAYPGGLLLYLSSLCTAFFYYPALGCALLGLCWAAIILLFSTAFALRPAWRILPVAAVGALLGTLVQMGYFMFYTKLPGYWFAATLGLLLVLLAVSVYRLLPARHGLHHVWMVLVAAVGYPLMGAYALLATLCMGITLLRQPKGSRYSLMAGTALCLALLAVVPIVAWNCYAQTARHCLYTAALPSFCIGEERYDQYYIPYYIVLGLPLLAALAGRGCPAPLRRPTVVAVLHLVVLATTATGLYQVWYRDINFHKELRMERAMEEGQWEEVLRIYSYPMVEPTRQMVMCKNLALLRLGRAGDEMFNYREGGASPNAPFSVHLPQVGGKALYYYYGQENFCYRWCMEDCVVYGWKTEYLKYMVKTSLVNGDYAVARKYTDMLSHSLFHKEWAATYRRYADQPSLIAQSEEFKPILALLPPENALASDLSVIEMFLLHRFVYTHGTHPLYVEQALIASLQMKDIPLFWSHFFDYATQLGQRHMPRHYQEAAYLYGHLEHQVDISTMPFDDEVRQSYKGFMELSRQCGSMTEAQMAEVLRPQYGHTFYYFYFLVNGLKTY